MRSAPLFIALVCSSALAQEGLSPLGRQPQHTVVDPAHDPRVLELKFRHDAGIRLEGQRFLAPDPTGVVAAELSAIDLYLDAIGARRERIFSQDDAWLRAWRAGGEARTGKALHDLTSFQRLVLPRDGLVAEACDSLAAFDVVELAYPLPSVGDPVAALLGTPDFEPDQDYREAAPLGVDADYGNRFSGGQGAGITIVDVETAWTDDHEDIAHAALGNFVGLMPVHYPWEHGTAVLGELVGEDNGLGVRGIAYGAGVLMSSHQGQGSQVPTAIANGAAAAGPGDFLVLEVQCFGGAPAPYPCEYVASTYSTVETATANGTHVFAAAGNGSNDLDGAGYGGAFDRNIRDSGSVIVGASNGSSLDMASFSNFGSRVDVHGWGFNVYTAGYGDVFNPSPTRRYTGTFSGTSSATPIATGAGIQLAGIQRSVFATDPTPLELRALLASTGTPQGAGGNIGPRPDVHAALAALDVPRIRVSGNLVPGGDFTVTSEGAAGRLNVLVMSDSLRANPLQISTFGSLFLAAPFSRVSSRVIPSGDSVDFDAQIPDDPGLSGTTFAYFQVWQRFPGSNGGSFGNWAPVEVQ